MILQIKYLRKVHKSQFKIKVKSKLTLNPIKISTKTLIN